MAQSQRKKQPRIYVADAIADAEKKAWKAMAGYKFWMFGYHAAQWVLLNRVSMASSLPNPFKQLVTLAREVIDIKYPGKPKVRLAGTPDDPLWTCDDCEWSGRMSKLKAVNSIGTAILVCPQCEGDTIGPKDAMEDAES